MLRTGEGEQKFVKASKEVILTAGTVGSTKLLLLSGVGPKEELQKLKVQNELFQKTPKFPTGNLSSFQKLITFYFLLKPGPGYVNHFSCLSWWFKIKLILFIFIFIFIYLFFYYFFEVFFRALTQFLRNEDSSGGRSSGGGKPARSGGG